MFAKKTCAVVKARIGMEEVKVTALPTRCCANLQTKRRCKNKGAEQDAAGSTVYKFHSHCQRNPFFLLAHWPSRTEPPHIFWTCLWMLYQLCSAWPPYSYCRIL